MKSLGFFEFKNVLQPLEVFAIANTGFVVPKKGDLKGKFKESKSKFNRKWIAPLALVSILSIVGIWQLWPKNLPLTKEQRNSQLAILPFENKTGSSELGSFGTMISDWLTSKLQETSQVNILRAENLQSRIAQAGMSPTDVNGLFASSGIDIIVKGNYHLLGDDLYAQANIVDSKTGLTIFAPNPVVKPKDQLRDILHELSQDILGYWNVRNINRYEQRPPRYEAYQAYLAALVDFDKYIETRDNRYGTSAEDHFKKAYELDTTFISPLVKLSIHYHNQNRFDAKDSLQAVVGTMQSRLTKWELNYYKFVRARSSGKWYEAGTIAEEMYNMDPSSWVSYTRAYQAYNVSNYLQKSIDLTLAVDTSLIPKNHIKWQKRNIDYPMYLQGRFEEVYTMFDQYFEEGPLHAWENLLYSQVLVQTRRFDKIPEIVLDAPIKGATNKGEFLYRICNTLLLIR